MPVSIAPLSVSTPVTSPRSTVIPVTRVLRVDLGAAPARSLGEREGQLARVDVAVAREVGRPEHAVGRHRREERLRLGRGDELERQSERLRPAGLARDLLEPLGRRGEAQRADLAPARLEPDLRLERAVELDRAHHHPRQRERASQLADEPGGVECRAARQIGPLDEDDIVPAEPRQPVEDRAAADTAADHDRTRAAISFAHLGRFDHEPRAVGAEAVAGELDRRAVGRVADRARRAGAARRARTPRARASDGRASVSSSRSTALTGRRPKPSPIRS